MPSGAITLTPGITLGVEQVTRAKLNQLGNPTARLDAASVTSRELNSSVLPVDPSAFVVLYDDFLTDRALSGVVGSTGLRVMTANSGSVTDEATLSSARPGQIALATNANSAGACWIRAASLEDGGIVLGGGVTTVEWGIKTPTAVSDGTDTYILYIGLANTAATGAEPTDGIYFTYTHSVSSGVWVGKTANGSSRTSVVSAVTVEAATWYNLKASIDAAATTVEFFINGTSAGTSSTNIPTGGTYLACGITKSAGTSSRVLAVDWVKLAITLTTAR